MVDAKIDLDKNIEYIQINGTAHNITTINQSIRFILSVIKNNGDSTNISKSDQQGRIVLDPAEKKTLSQTRINSDDQDRMIILLLVYNTEDELIGKDRIILNGTAEDRTEEDFRVQREKESTTGELHKEDDGVFLKGIVVEETKTKPGRDFFKIFYSLYNSYNVNGERVVTIKESFAIASTTKIEIKIGTDTVMEFFIQPNNDFLKSAANQAVRTVFLYFQDLKENKNEVKQY